MTVAEFRKELIRMAVELIMLLPGLSFETVMEFGWKELVEWRAQAIETYKNLRGIE